MPTCRILFVCLGNICRSPCAEGVMKHLVAEQGLSESYSIDSAGTGDWHAGQLADPRMRRAALALGYPLTSIARQVRAPLDFDSFDHIVAMDRQNLHDLQALARHDADLAKLSLMTDYCTRYDLAGVPDPYFGGDEGFTDVIHILEDGCAELLRQLAAQNAR